MVNDSRTHYLLKCMWNIIYDRPYVMSQNKFQKFLKTEIMQSNFSNHSGMNLEITNRKKTGNFTNTKKFNNVLLNNRWVKEEIAEEIRKSFEMNKNKTTT